MLHGSRHPGLTPDDKSGKATPLRLSNPPFRSRSATMHRNIRPQLFHHTGGTLACQSRFHHFFIQRSCGLHQLRGQAVDFPSPRKQRTVDIPTRLLTHRVKYAVMSFERAGEPYVCSPRRSKWTTRYAWNLWNGPTYCPGKAALRAVVSAGGRRKGAIQSRRTLASAGIGDPSVASVSAARYAALCRCCESYGIDILSTSNSKPRRVLAGTTESSTSRTSNSRSKRL